MVLGVPILKHFRVWHCFLLEYFSVVFFPELEDSCSVDSDTSRFSDIIEPITSSVSGKTTTSDNRPQNSDLKSESYLHADSSMTEDRKQIKIDATYDASKDTNESSDNRNILLNNKLETNESLPGNIFDNRTTENCDMAKGDASNSKSDDNFSAIATELVVGSEDLASSGESLKLPVKMGLTVPSVDLGVNDIVTDILKEGSENSDGRFLVVGIRCNRYMYTVVDPGVDNQQALASVLSPI